MKKVLVTGGDGRFAQNLKKIKSSYAFVYKNKREFDSYKDYFSDRKKNKSINVSKTLINEKFHTLELFNWLNYIKNSN